MAMAHVLLKEYFVDKSVDFFTDYNQRFTDLPFLVTLTPMRMGSTSRASSSWSATSRATASGLENAMWKPMFLDAVTGEAVAPTARSASATAKRAWASGTSTSRTPTPN